MSNSSEQQVELGQSLYENENYKVIVGEIHSEVTEQKELGYYVVNTNTGITESRVFVYPQARMFADDFNKMVQEYDAEDANETVGLVTAPAQDHKLKH